VVSIQADNSIDPGERPLLTVDAGWPKDVLSWIMAAPPRLYLGAVAAGFAGFSTFVILLLVTSHPLVGTVMSISQPVAIPTVLSIFLVLCFLPQLIPLRHGAALRTE
jgi:hypothetical protein